MEFCLVSCCKLRGKSFHLPEILPISVFRYLFVLEEDGELNKSESLNAG